MEKGVGGISVYENRSALAMICYPEQWKSEFKKDDFWSLLTSNCTLVLPGTGTGEDNSMRIHVSSSLISLMQSGGMDSFQWPVSTDHTRSLKQKNDKVHFRNDVLTKLHTHRKCALEGAKNRLFRRQRCFTTRNKATLHIVGRMRW